jgi:choline dehydrogenase-like flavoprotein
MSCKQSVIVVGSGAGGSVAAWALATAGHPVLVLEKGRDLLPGLGGTGPIGSLFGNDDIKEGRAFENQDPVLEPRTFRTQQESTQGIESSFVGDVNDLPTVVGGGTVHWDAKVPRFWRQDFKARSLYGPVAGASVADWPLTYDDLEPFYTEVEERLGVQGDAGQLPARTRQQAPHSKPYPMPPNPPMYAGLLLKAGAASLGYSAYPFPMGVNSQAYDGRPRCNNCGFCSGYGCPINARAGAAVSFLHHALQAGAELRSRCFVFRIDMASKTRAAGVSYIDPAGRVVHETADIIVVAPSAIETARLLLMSANADHPTGLGNRSDQVGRNLMFHFFTLAAALFPENVHATRGPSTTFVIDDFVGPDRPPAATQVGLPYLKGGICEVGGTLGMFSEMSLYAAALPAGGSQHKALMKTSAIRLHLAGLSMVGEDMPQAANRVDLDPTAIRDVYGFPVPRITHSAHAFEVAASQYYGPRLQALCQAAPGAIPGASFFIPVGTLAEPGPGNAVGGIAAGPASTAHIMGTARMGDDPATSVADAFGRLHDVDNVYLGDGAVFATAAGMNPTVTIMALALRMARRIACGEAPQAAAGAPVRGDLPNTAAAGDQVGPVLAAGAVVGAAAGLGVARHARKAAPSD